MRCRILPYLVGCLVCLLMTMLGTTTYAKGSSRHTINWLTDCGWKHVDQQFDNTPQHVCAQALQTMIANLPQHCNDFNLEHFKASTLVAVRNTIYSKQSIAFQALGRQRFLVSFRCELAAYNISYVYYIYDESQGAKGITQLVFADVMDAKLASFSPIVFARAVKISSRMIYVLIKGRGLGDFGVYARYRFFDNGSTKLLELRRLDEGDSQYPPYPSFNIHQPPNWPLIDISTSPLSR